MVVAEGWTVWLPSRFTAPMPLSISQVAASWDCQLSCTVCPASMTKGEALIDTAGGTIPCGTAESSLERALSPPALTAVTAK